jgi:hypothetical protein
VLTRGLKAMSASLDLCGRRAKRLKTDPAVVELRANDSDSPSECFSCAVRRCVMLSRASLLAGDTDVDSDAEIRSVGLCLHPNSSANNRVLTPSLES